MSQSLLDRAKRGWYRRQLTRPEFGFLFDPAPDDEWVSIDCETTGLDRQKDHIISIGAVRIKGQTLHTSERLEILVKPSDDVLASMQAESIKVHRVTAAELARSGITPHEAAERVLQFIGPRPLVGYYLEFDVAMLNRLVRPVIGIPLPNVQCEVSGLYYDLKYKQNPDSNIDLRFAPMMADLKLPTREAHDPVNDAVMAALAFVKLRTLTRL